MERISTGLRNEIMKVGGKSYADALANCTLHIFSGTQPASADDAETGTLLVPITDSSGAFTSGVATNGLNWGDCVAGILSKLASQVWSGVAVASGQAGWFRIYANTVVTGASTTAIRIDGAINLSNAEINSGNLTITIGGTTTIDALNVTLPAS